MTNNRLKKQWIRACIGTVAVALCCFTPLLVASLSLIGLGSLIPYLDFVLLPALALMLVLMVVSFVRWKKGTSHCCQGAHTVDTPKEQNIATLTCPYCKATQETQIPQTGCLAFYKCDNCQRMIEVPKESKKCCVICEYSDTKCPVAE